MVFHHFVTLQQEGLGQEMGVAWLNSCWQDGLGPVHGAGSGQYLLQAMMESRSGGAVSHVESFSFLPQGQRNGGDLARQGETRQVWLHAFGQQGQVKVSERSGAQAGMMDVRFEQIVEPGSAGAFFEGHPQASTQSGKELKNGRCFRL